MLYPPFADIGVVAFIGEDRQNVHEAANYFSERLKTLAENRFSELPLRVMGPAPAAVAKVGGKFRYRMIIKFKNSRRFREMMSELLIDIGNSRRFSSVTAYADIDPDNII